VNGLKQLFTNSKNIVAFTGAGLSSESGIPTYRGVGGIWNKYDPMKYANIDYFMNDPSYYWSFFRDVRYPIIKNAKPNLAHNALVDFEKQNKLCTVITQNIDGLHQIAGQSKVIELHGNTREIYCMDCSKIISMDEAFKLLNHNFSPRCQYCNGILRPNTVFFGEPLSQQKIEEAVHVAKNCNLFLAIGSSLVVSPASNLPQIAKDAKASLVIVNIDSTHLDYLADIVIHDKASKILSNLIKR
jgi:NAD-dependent deacetylase